MIAVLAEPQDAVFDSSLVRRLAKSADLQTQDADAANEWDQADILHPKETTGNEELGTQIEFQSSQFIETATVDFFRPLAQTIPSQASHDTLGSGNCGHTSQRCGSHGQLSSGPSQGSSGPSQGSSGPSQGSSVLSPDLLAPTPTPSTRHSFPSPLRGEREPLSSMPLNGIADVVKSLSRRENL